MSNVLSFFHKSGEWEEVKAILTQLIGAGHISYLAGGCVRDALIGREVNDYDIATSASVENMKDLFPKTIDVGANFGTIMVPINKGVIEITQFRKDGQYTDGRRPESVEAGTPEEDAQRRDFTMNALFFDINSSDLIDYVDGKEDINQKKIRTVGDAKERFEEDKLRMWRAVRFRSQLGWGIDSKTFLAIQSESTKTKLISKERVTQELSKLLSGDYAIKGIECLNESGLADAWFCKKLILSEAGSDYFHSKRSNPDCDWLVFLQNNPSALSQTLLPKKLRNLSAEFTHSLSEFPSMKKSEKLKMLHSDLGPCFVHYCERANSPWSDELTELENEFPELPKAMIDGNDLLKGGFSKGPKIRKVLDEVYDLQIEMQVNSKAEALEAAKRIWQTSN